MVEVVDLAQHRKPTDPELIESLRIMLSEAQNGRLVALVAVCMNEDRELDPVCHAASNFDAVAMADWLLADMRKLMQPED